ALRQIASPDEPIYASPGTFADLAIDLQAELDCPDRFTPTVMATLIPLCAIRLLRLQEERGHYPAWMHVAVAIGRAQFTEKITSTGLAQQLGISQGQLARGFRRYKQRSLRQFVDELRLNEARRQLLDSSLRVADIAQRLGYFDQSQKCW